MRSMFDVSGRVALVTGGNSGLGLAMARGLSSAGARVAIAARRGNRNEAALSELGEGASAFELDVTDEASVERVIAATVERFGRLDILINNAGVVHRKSVMELDREAWDHVMAVNVTGVFLCTKHAARVMAKQRSGKIINISSVYGMVGPSKGLQVAYTASKHAVIGLTRANAVELAPLGIQVNAILPGWHFTEINAEARGTAFEQSVSKRTPMGRWATAEELVGLCVYLSSPASDFVTGSCMVQDGGYSASDGLDRG
jgi:2-dehydro-3-deoxy-D-gluconate 5-dehydrogenase